MIGNFSRMENTNLVLSEEERRMAKDASVILTKNRIIQYVYNIFGQISSEDRDQWDLLTSVAGSLGPKISRGENLSGLPWVMLDYPRLFKNEDILAVRILFWWGNFFSITLHVNGKYQLSLSDSIVQYYSLLANDGWSIDMGNDPWNHDQSIHTYQSIATLDKDRIVSIIKNKKHFRISKKYELDHQWDFLEGYLKADRSTLYHILSNSL